MGTFLGSVSLVVASIALVVAIRNRKDVNRIKRVLKEQFMIDIKRWWDMDGE